MVSDLEIVFPSRDSVRWRLQCLRQHEETLEAEVREVTSTAYLALINCSIVSIGSVVSWLFSWCRVKLTQVPGSTDTSSEGLPGDSGAWFSKRVASVRAHTREWSPILRSILVPAYGSVSPSTLYVIVVLLNLGLVLPRQLDFVTHDFVDSRFRVAASARSRYSQHSSLEEHGAMS